MGVTAAIKVCKIQEYDETRCSSFKGTQVNFTFCFLVLVMLAAQLFGGTTSLSAHQLINRLVDHFVPDKNIFQQILDCLEFVWMFLCKLYQSL